MLKLKVKEHKKSSIHLKGAGRCTDIISYSRCRGGFFNYEGEVFFNPKGTNDSI
jgi:hypothetical protein